ncbi:hypothetical protein HK098_006483 [Nowakowskiella sp. JEL0407]|nr:hypothetical protein HK098_006483 [Nowakowskiella sp. JEL0407]
MKMLMETLLIPPIRILKEFYFKSELLKLIFQDNSEKIQSCATTISCAIPETDSEVDEREDLRWGELVPLVEENIMKGTKIVFVEGKLEYVFGRHDDCDYRTWNSCCSKEVM